MLRYEIGFGSSQPSSQLSDYFAPLVLRVVTPRLTLQLPSGPELYQLLHVIERGIHDPSQMPFINAWTDLAVAQTRARVIGTLVATTRRVE